MSNSAINNNEIPFGTIVDSRYLIQKVLGQGGLGRTYLALDTHRFNEPCVLKEFAPLGSGQYDLEKSRNLFKREAKILHQITHPQIPKFLACFEGKNRLFLVQEYVKGKTYSQLLQERQQQGQVFSEVEVSRWLMNMLPILTYIHQRGIIHRDISPDNIMQPQAEELPVLIDFGVGKLTNLGYAETEHVSDSHGHSFVGKMSFVGKIGYAPREQISMGRCSPSSDLYSLGVTAIVLLTGKMPTLLLDQYTLEWQWRRYAQTSREFTQIINRMIEDRPMQRYQTTEEVITNLQEMRQSQDYIFTPELTEITDAHFYQKIPLFAEKQASKTSKKSKSDLMLTSNEETIINPSFASQVKHQILKPNHLLDTTSEGRKAETSRKKYVPKSKFTKDIIPPNKAITHSNETNSSASVDLVSYPSKSTPIYPETLRQPLAKPNNYQNQGQDSLGSINSVVDNSQIQHKRIEKQFIKRCQQELAYIIGPMASLIVEEVLIQYAPLSPEKLVEALAEQIPSNEQAIKFKRKLLS